jgi:radical SAM protein with 4Fe4S-binding SPASM domain
MSIDEYKRIITQAGEGNLPALHMNTLNEPLLMKDMVERIRFAKENGIMDILMNTNGTMLTEKISKELVDSGLTRLLVSLDAYTEETYNKVRIGSNYRKVMKNIETFLEVRGSRPLPLLRISFVRMKINQHEVEEFVNFWEERADMVAIQEYIPMSDRQVDLDQICEDEGLDDEDYFCTDPWTRMVIRANGDVLPCCSTQLYPNYVLGNIRESSISELWNGERMKSLRRTIYTQDESNRSEMCKKCRLFK